MPPLVQGGRRGGAAGRQGGRGERRGRWKRPFEFPILWLFGLHMFLTVPLYLVVGWAAGRFPKPPVLMWASLAGTASFALLASPWHGRGVLLAFVVLFAMCDASAPTNWAVVGEYFGRQTFSRLQG